MTENPLCIGRAYLLRLPDGRTLGRVRIETSEDQWAEGPLAPDGAFEEFRPLFEEERALRQDQVIPLWEQAADRIDALQIEVVGEDGARFTDFRIFVDDGTAILAPSLTST